jgi:uncharacterized membrane protein YphA (DoxX/SURF4 family)
MKATNITYWVLTILFGGFMLFSGIGNAMCNADSIKLLHDAMGYPIYIISFLGIAKILGVIGILVPRFPRIKEWAYAGLMFDLIGATYSFMALGGEMVSGIVFMFITIAVGFASYFLHHKRLKAKAANI